VSNSWFRFKQFKINQDRTAMKVGTDGVLLGAWTDVANAKRVLDIGTGTGLIALMIAQRNSEAVVDAIDIDEHACGQAEENAAASPWWERVKVTHSSLEQFAENTDDKYDLIVCNPPYFINSKRSDDEKRRLARHADELTLEHLFRASAVLLADTGRMGIVFPFVDKDKVIKAAARNGLHPEKILNVKHNEEKQPVRVLISFSKERNVFAGEKDIAIETGVRHNYTKEFSDLVRDFYLYVD
jgi:tRNA1Val (adenine37-N6)-methyltransferase